MPSDSYNKQRHSQQTFVKVNPCLCTSLKTSELVADIGIHAIVVFGSLFWRLAVV